MNQANGLNNANFGTPPDGQPGVMRMFRWTTASPDRDSSLDNQIVIHGKSRILILEYGHGISNRLAGGSASANCLQTDIAMGMGEGWSDTLAIYLTRKASDKRTDDATVGAYATNNAGGVRSKPYSVSMKQNPYTLESVKDFAGVHAIGEYWALTLFEMYWNLVVKEGFATDLYDSKQIKGNVIALQLVIGGMKMQPCNPTFTTARDAIIAADLAYYGGAYNCLIWRAFAKRGLGTDSDEISFKNGFAVPPACELSKLDQCLANGNTIDACNGKKCSWRPFGRRMWCGWPW